MKNLVSFNVVTTKYDSFRRFLCVSIHDNTNIFFSLLIFGGNIKEATPDPTTRQQFKRGGYWFREKELPQITKSKEGMN